MSGSMFSEGVDPSGNTTKNPINILDMLGTKKEVEYKDFPQAASS